MSYHHTDVNFTGNFFSIHCLIAVGGGLRFFRDPLALELSGGSDVPWLPSSLFVLPLLVLLSSSSPVYLKTVAYV